MLDKIFVHDMEFYGYHGVFPEENKLGQRFRVNLTVELDLHKAGKTDDLHDSVNYGELFHLCEEIVEGKPYKLIEAVAESIATAILNKYTMIQRCTITVIKPNPPLRGHYHSVAAEITRDRV